MTALVEEPEFAPVRELPNGELFHSPLGLFNFQADGIAEAYVRTDPGTPGGVLAVYDTGLGKTIIGIAMAAFLFADDQIDLCVVISERNKLVDWRDEFDRFSALSTHLYHGPGRQKRLAKAGTPHVFCTTYETGRNELMGREKVHGRRSKGKAVDGPLLDALGLRGKRVLWIFDEVTRLKGRSSELHKSYDYALGQLRKNAHQRVLGLTATPMERDYEDAYNLGRIVCPELMPTVAEFERTFTSGVDNFGRYMFRNDRKEQFAELFQGVIMRKRKTDDDVVQQFPRQVEKSLKVEAHRDHARFYAAVEGLFDPSEGQADTRTEEEIDYDERRLFTALRMTAGHPCSHLHAESIISQTLVDSLGEDVLRSIPSSKTEELISRLKPLVKGQGAQAIIFTFYGGTVLRELVDELRKAGYATVEYHGGRSLTQNEYAKEEFIAGRAELFVTSDAGSRGLNLQNAEYVFEYESALTHANRTQRINRVHRITSDHPLVTAYTLILEDSIEEGIIEKVLKRNADQDILLGDNEDGTAFVSASKRRELLQIARRR